MADVLSNYRPGAAYDEMIDAEGGVRPSYQAIHSSLSRSTPTELRHIADSLASNYTQAGVTFDVGVPSQLITSSTHFHRAVWGIEPANGVRVHVAGVDLIRNPDGDVRVLEDNVRVPSGVSYVMTNRSAMITALPGAFANQRIRPVAGYPTRLLAALRKCAPSGVDDPTVVVLTPGVYNSAYFEHTLLARTMGVELVEGRDLECRRGKVYMRTTAGLQRVDVIYRRVDDEFLDPVHFRGDSMLGVPGLVNAVRTGGVALANAIGNGVADDKLIYTYVPDLIRYYLSEDPIIPNVDTWRLEEDEARAEVFDRLPELVVKPVAGSGGKGIVIGPRASQEELDELRRTISLDPRGWIAQPLVQLSTVPTLIGDQLRPRHVDLRPFAVNNGDSVWVLPGGLTRVALPEGELVVNSSQGGGSKDTWVLSPPPHYSHPETKITTAELPLDRAAAESPAPASATPLATSPVPLAVGRVPASVLPHQDDQRAQSEQQQQARPTSPALAAPAEQPTRLHSC